METIYVVVNQKQSNSSINQSSTSIDKKNLAPLGITAVAYAINAEIQNKIHGSETRTLKILNEEMNDMMKIVKALEDSNILLKGITKTIENKIK